MPRPGVALACCLILLCVVGCVESSWVIPHPRTAAPSKLWTTDPRTRGWNGVEALYDLYGDGHVEAHIRSFDGHHRFKARGESWYENEQGQRFTTFLSPDLSPVFVVRFDHREERYLAAAPGTGTNRGRALNLFRPATTRPIPD
jgi:hypothetical protein